MPEPMPNPPPETSAAEQAAAVRTEEPPMIDIHPPHESVRSWKDVFIHLGIITVGLLIAISLEQGVEKLHQIHERHQLEAGLRVEAKQNLIIMDLDRQYFDARKAWLLALRQDIDTVRASGGKIKLPLRPAPKDDGAWFPDAPVWNTAKQSATIGLLPRDEAGMYNIVYNTQELMTASWKQYHEASDRQASFENRFSGEISIHPHAADLSRMTPEDLQQYSVLISDTLTQLLIFRDITEDAHTVTSAADQGARSDEDLFRMIGARPGDTAPAH